MPLTEREVEALGQIFGESEAPQKQDGKVKVAGTYPMPRGWIMDAHPDRGGVELSLVDEHMINGARHIVHSAARIERQQQDPTLYSVVIGERSLPVQEYAETITAFLLRREVGSEFDMFTQQFVHGMMIGQKMLEDAVARPVIDPDDFGLNAHEYDRNHE